MDHNKLWRILKGMGIPDFQETCMHEKKNSAKERSNDHIIALISHASKIMLKILEARLQQYVNQKLPEVQAGFRKEKPEIKSPLFTGS